jgi:hypothetical protein
MGSWRRIGSEEKMRVTREMIRQTIHLREDELDIYEKYALYEGSTKALLDFQNLSLALKVIRTVWSTVHTGAEKRRREARSQCHSQNF